MELRELRLRIFHPPRAAFALIARHLSSLSSMTPDEFRETVASSPGVVYEVAETHATIDGIDLGSSEGEARAERRTGEESRNPREDRVLMNHTPRCLRPTE